MKFTVLKFALMKFAVMKFAVMKFAVMKEIRIRRGSPVVNKNAYLEELMFPRLVCPAIPFLVTQLYAKNYRIKMCHLNIEGFLCTCTM